jgi:hypothetical protein
MLSRIVPATPTVCPVPLETLRRHAVITNTYDDDLLKAYGVAATELCENFTNRYFLQRSVQWTLSNDRRHQVWPYMNTTQLAYFNTFQHPWLHCPHSAVSIEQFAIGTWGQADTVLVEGTDYEVDTATDPARIHILNFNVFDPNTDHLTVNYTSGYSTDATGVPPALLGAIMMLATRLREGRGDQDTSIWACGAEALLAPYTVIRLGGGNDLHGP